MASKNEEGSAKASQRLYSIEYDGDVGALTPLEGQSIIDLYRSLDIGGIVAYIGSGNSTLLGYGNWDQLAQTMLKLASERIERHGAPASKPIRDSERHLPERLKNAIAHAMQNTDKAADIDKFDRLALATEALRYLSPTVPDGNESDDDPSGPGWGDLDHNDVERNDTLRSQFSFPATQTIQSARTIIDRLSQTETYRSSALRMQATLRALGDHAFVPIDYIEGIRLADCISRDMQLSGTSSDAATLKLPADKTRWLDAPTPSIDVLGTLRKEWRISRYATLNYDHEIERMLEHTDFPFESLTPHFTQASPPETGVARKGSGHDHKLVTRSRLGEKARSVDLDRSNLAEFMLFAADSPSGVSQVLHLHGSVRDPAQMIVTDIDYNRRYFVDAPWNQVLEDSQELLYRGNAIVFIGVGMSEDYLFRAMRILSQAPEREARPVYAFMESKGPAKDTADGIKLFQRYGIRTIFYGTKLDIESDPEAGDFMLHPLVEDLIRLQHPGPHCITPAEELELRKKIARLASPLSLELKCLRQVSEFLLELQKQERQDRLAWIGMNKEALDKKLKEITGLDFVHLSSEDHGKTYVLPRLRATVWHRDVFRMVMSFIGGLGTSAEIDETAVAAAIDAVARTRSAIHSRAIQDAIQAIYAKSVDWRKRWLLRPTVARAPGNDALHFRSADAVRPANVGIQTYVHNVSMRHDGRDANRELLKCILDDESGSNQYSKACAFLGTHRVVMARARSGAGKGMLATSFSESGPVHADERLVVSFGQSCGRESLFDLLAARYLETMRAENSGQSLEVVISKSDILMTASEKRPKLAEWDAFFTIAMKDARIRWLILCENGESTRYFSALVNDAVNSVALETSCSEFKLWDIKTEEAFRRKFGDDDGGTAPRMPMSPSQKDAVFDIAKTSGSVWVASFLTSVYAEFVRPLSRSEANGCSGGAAGADVTADIGQIASASESFGEIIHRVRYVLNVTQDPRQKVPNIIDAAITRIEAHVLRNGDATSRITKIISHAILKHLFAFGGPVEECVFEACPEFQRIQGDYDSFFTDHVDLADMIGQALHWLRRLDMVIASKDCYGSDERIRYSLHSHIRNWLATKKGLPFSVVAGREQTAITVIPVIDEEIVPLDRGDYQFIWETIDGLLRPDDSDRPTTHAHVRAAFMLLRGSMRIGSVLRSAHGAYSEGAREQTPLEHYLRCLLDLRRAALSCASARPSEVAPLFEREWIWLFNEMGVVKLLQGHAHDASALFEQAIEFERERLRENRAPVEAVIYGKHPDAAGFSVTKLRIMINLALAEIEKGAFNRAGRIVSGEKRDIDSLQEVFSARPVKVSKSRSLHREVRILALVLGLIDARLKFLSGGAGEAVKWLVDSEESIVAEGVHGLTALYSLIRADVESARKNHVLAAEKFAIARAEAEASGRSDLIFSVMLGESELKMAVQRRPGAAQLQQQLGRIRKIKHEAERMGLLRIEVTACMLRARLYLGFGEHRSARQDLMRALTLSTSCGLHTKRVSALIDMAALVGSLDAELRHEARDIARSARFDAERMGYKLAAARAKDLELVLREQGSIEEWLSRSGGDGLGHKNQDG